MAEKILKLEVKESRLAWLIPVARSEGAFVLVSAGDAERAAVIATFDGAIRLGDAFDDLNRVLTRMGQPLEPTKTVVLSSDVMDYFGMLDRVKQIFTEIGSDQMVACFGVPVELGLVEKPVDDDEIVDDEVAA